MNRREFVVGAGAVGAMALAANASGLGAQARGADIQGGGLSPALWSQEERDKYLALEQDWTSPHPAAIGHKGMVAGTSGPLAVHAGLTTLQHGGSAADAAVATALAQIPLMGGSAISYAGIMSAVCYEASTKKLYSMNACYNTVKGETNGASIPSMGTPSGRSALVPGFMAGAGALSKKFGKLPFASLFDPAIWVAENGFILNSHIGDMIAQQTKFITRLPESKKIFVKKNGELYGTGDLFQQPYLAATLRKIATQGTDYMYKGEWAEKLVAAVQDQGGKMTKDDLASYGVLWDEPLLSSYRDYRIATLASPSSGGATTVLGFNLLEAADLKRLGQYTTSAEALYWLIQVTRIALTLPASPPEMLGGYFPGVDLSRESLVKPDTAKKIWQRMQKGDWSKVASEIASPSAPKHSAGVLAVDAAGNVVSIVQSINTVGWGTSGIFVEGISIPDSASFQQALIARTVPGNRLPDPTNPLMILKNGKPVVASSAIGSALNDATWICLTNILDSGMEPKQAADQPEIMGPYYGISSTGAFKPEPEKETLVEGDFPATVIDGVRQRGQALALLPNEPKSRAQRGYWIGIQIDPESGELKGGNTPGLNGRTEGY
jgi:gamma-glutamyltranspeptidase/glutathione hydrolase